MHFLSGIFAQLTFLLLHVDHTAAFPPALSKSEEAMWLERLAEGSEEARQKLITHNLRLVAHMTKKFYSPEREQEELISIGTLGLIKAVSTFRPEKGARFLIIFARCEPQKIHTGSPCPAPSPGGGCPFTARPQSARRRD